MTELSKELIERFWDALWLGIRPFLRFMQQFRNIIAIVANTSEAGTTNSTIPLFLSFVDFRRSIWEFRTSRPHDVECMKKSPKLPCGSLFGRFHVLWQELDHPHDEQGYV